jgi:6-methylsalicylic acid synthase
MESIAVVGMGCRLPGGVESPDDFWRLLQSGKDAIGPLDAARWQAYLARGGEVATALAGVTTDAGYLSDVEGFDAEFFGISPREAAVMDPQHRLLLEATWDALEDAGVPPHSLRGSDTGVFAGIGSDDYGRRLLEDLPCIEPWTGIGSALCGAANRVSYALDLRGPSLAVDTACSSSLVAVHLACESLRREECGIAIAGGVNLILAPGPAVTLQRAGTLAGDGRSKPFDAGADGYGRGEGCGVVVLKRMSDARRNGDRVYAVILGSAVAQDGRTNGIMAPSEEAQVQLLRRACRQARVTPGSIGYVEAHGTGTPAGDAVEASALRAVYGHGRAPGEPCLIGSVKSTIGHLEAGAGSASLIKSVLVLRHGEIPATLHCDRPNPQIDWADAGLRVVTAATPWARARLPRRIGVSAFGYGGTIAHLVLEEAPRPALVDVDFDRPGPPWLVPLSGASPDGLRAQADRLARWLTDAGRDVPLGDIGYTLAERRTHLPCRAAPVASGHAELAAALREIASGGGDGTATDAAARDATAHDATAHATAHDGGGHAVWVLSGHGSQWAGMGRQLLATEPAFAAVINDVDAIYQEELGFSPRAAIQEDDLGGVDRIQPMICAVQIGLVQTLREYGLRPAAVIGHSVGEIAAAVAAGILDIHEGARLVCRRSRLLRQVAGRGAMVLVDLAFDEVCGQLAGADGVWAAIDAAPRATVVGGDPGAVAGWAARWQAAGQVVRSVATDVAFHSPHMDPLLPGIAAAATGIVPRPPGVVVYSTALADPRDPRPRDSAYWAANLRNPVRFNAAVRAALDDGYRTFVEIAPHPVVSHSILEVVAATGTGDVRVLGTLRRQGPERALLLAAIGELFVAGEAVDWPALRPGRRLVTLPPRAWLRQRHWQDPVAGGPPPPARHDPSSHTLLGARLSIGGEEGRMTVWRTTLDRDGRPYPADHTVQGVEVVPAAVVVGSFVAAADSHPLAGVSLRLPLTPDPPREIQVVRRGAELRLVSRPQDDGDGEWLTHATARVAAGPVPGAGATAELVAAELVAADEVTAAATTEVAEYQGAVGVPTMAFEWRVLDLARGDGRLRCRVSTDPAATRSWAPAIDAALSVAPLVFGQPTLRMVSRLANVRLSGPPPAEFCVLARRRPGGAHEATVDVAVLDPGGCPVAELTGVEYREVEPDVLTAADPAQLVYETTWRPFTAPSAGTAPARVVMVGGTPELRAAVGAALGESGIRWTATAWPEMLAAFRVESTPPDAVLVLATAPDGTDAATAAHTSGWLLARTAKLLSTWPKPPALWCLTEGVRECADLAAVCAAPCWGLGRVLAGEHPELWGGIVDLDPARPGGAASQLAKLLAAGRGEDVFAVRDGAVSVARLALTARPPVRPALDCTADGTYLITGGLGALGLRVAAWLSARGARHLVLTSRRPFPPRSAGDGHPDPRIREQVAGIRALEAAGVTVRVVELDAGDRERAAAVLAPGALKLPPVRGVVHLAGVLDDRMAMELDEASLGAVMHPKVTGALVLHEMYPPGSLDFFVLFSSAGQLLRIPGQSSYASANAFLDGLARHRAALGDPGALSVCWTSWRGMGMSVSAVVEMELRARGTVDISADEAFAAWSHAARRDTPNVAVLRTVRQPDAGDTPPLLRDLEFGAPGGSRAGACDAAGAGSDEWDDPAWLDRPADEVRESLITAVARQITDEMKMSLNQVDLRRPLVDLGLDSVMFLIVRRRLAQRFRLDLPATLLWTRPTVVAIAEFLLTALQDRAGFGR